LAEQDLLKSILGGASSGLGLASAIEQLRAAIALRQNPLSRTALSPPFPETTEESEARATQNLLLRSLFGVAQPPTTRFAPKMLATNDRERLKAMIRMRQGQPGGPEVPGMGILPLAPTQQFGDVTPTDISSLALVRNAANNALLGSSVGSSIRFPTGSSSGNGLFGLGSAGTALLGGAILPLALKLLPGVLDKVKTLFPAEVGATGEGIDGTFLLRHPELFGINSPISLPEQQTLLFGLQGLFGPGLDTTSLNLDPALFPGADAFADMLDAAQGFSQFGTDLNNLILDPGLFDFL